jgi:hypothetical protein
MTIPDYETKVPESIRKDNSDKLAGYDAELAECAKQIADWQIL